MANDFSPAAKAVALLENDQADIKFNVSKDAKLPPGFSRSELNLVKLQQLVYVGGSTKFYLVACFFSEKDNKFHLCISHGRTGTKGRVIYKGSFLSSDAAFLEADNIVNRKKNRGYIDLENVVSAEAIKKSPKNNKQKENNKQKDLSIEVEELAKANVVKERRKKVKKMKKAFREQRLKKLEFFVEELF